MGAPSGSGKIRPGSKYTNVGGPNTFKGQTKHLTESSGTIRSTPISGAIEKGRQSPDFGPSWKDSQNDRGK